MIKKIIKTEDIYTLSNFNIPLLQEAIRQAELKIQDENSRKERIDKKVYFKLPFIILLITWIAKEIYLLPRDLIFKNCFSIGLSCSLIILVISAVFLHIYCFQKNMEE